MSEFPLDPLYLGVIDNNLDELRQFKLALRNALGTPNAMIQLFRDNQRRVCQRIGNPVYEDPESSNTKNRLFQNPIFPELCCGVLVQVKDDMARIKFARGGEFVILDPKHNAYWMLWIDAKAQLFRRIVGPDNQTRFHPPTEQDLLHYEANKATEFFIRQRVLAGQSMEEIQKIPAVRLTDSAQFKLG